MKIISNFADRLNNMKKRKIITGFGTIEVIVDFDRAM